MTGSNHICLTDNSLCVPMVMTLIIFLSLVGSLKGLFLDPCYWYINDLPNASESLTFHLFADDTNIYCACRNLIDVELEPNHELIALLLSGWSPTDWHLVLQKLVSLSFILKIETIQSSIMSDKQNRTSAKRESDLLITSLITEWIERHDVLLPINQN